MKLIYISHPETEADAEVPVAQWPLAGQGISRAITLSRRNWPGKAWRAIASGEAKAQQTAKILFPSGFETWNELGEIDRSATGWLEAEDHAEQMRLFYEEPHESARGWERAVDARARMEAAVRRIWMAGRDTVLVGHGTVGTLLWSALLKSGIDQRHHQSSNGQGWMAESFGPGAWRPIHGWRPFEAL